METRLTMAVMVVRAGPLRSSIQALMSTMPQIQIVAEAKEISAMLQMKPEINPDIVLIEAGLADETVGLVMQEIKEKWVGTRTVVLVENDVQRQMAADSGADAVLFEGFRAARFVEEIDRLLMIENPNGERS